MFIPLPEDAMLDDAKEQLRPRPVGVATTRKKLLDAAEDLFSTRGYHRTQVADLTARAGTGVGTFYRYFEGKEEVMRELLTGFLSGIRDQVAALRAGIETREPLEQIDMVRENFSVILSEFQARPALALMLLRNSYGVNEEINELAWELVKQMAADIVSDIERAELAGLIEVQAKDALAHAIAGSVLQCAHNLLADGAYTREQAVEVCTRFTLGGLGAFATEEYHAALAPLHLELSARARGESVSRPPVGRPRAS